MLSRRQMVEKLQWNRGGYGFGICEVAMSMMWAMDRPGPGKSDLKSVVAVSWPPKRYTDQELKKILAFSERITADYDKMFQWRRGANLVLIDKLGDGRWLVKRLSWKNPVCKPTLEEAFAVIEKNQKMGAT